MVSALLSGAHAARPPSSTLQAYIAKSHCHTANPPYDAIRQYTPSPFPRSRVHFVTILSTLHP